MDIKEHIKNNKLKIIVKPNSPKNEIREWDESKESLRVNINAAPDKNKANEELVKFFSKLIGRKVKIKTGFSSRNKTIEIL